MPFYIQTPPLTPSMVNPIIRNILDTEEEEEEEEDETEEEIVVDGPAFRPMLLERMSKVNSDSNLMKSAAANSTRLAISGDSRSDADCAELLAEYVDVCVAVDAELFVEVAY
ncbi:unnamed protein product [Caenorhabditis angaria]|uniref:Uncharacterized protein n=1 Tax=Caenorhabditis angaria TaxID=860376 RepID=A0A9P1IUM3_9PELO|nr:unnamed protein product [Caenorhabditis angaria]